MIIKWPGQRVLVVAAHFDDEVLPGATLAHAHEATIGVAAFSPAVESLPKGFRREHIRAEFRASCDVLGAEIVWEDRYAVRRLAEHQQDILERLISLRTSWEPTIILCPSSTDVHQDHEVIHESCVRAFRNAPLVLGWESPNNERGTFEARMFVEVTPEDLEVKLEAWRQYASQAHRTAYSEELIRALAIVRGSQCRCESGLAEAFELVSMRS